MLKSWVGPESSPITGTGPSWPSSFKYPSPQNYSDVGKHATELLQFPLGMYLCGLLNEYVYFSYAWWYGWYQGYYPCETVNECTVPITGWYDEFTNKLGEPLTDGIWTQNRMICHRSFEFVNVSVNLTSQTSEIIWNLTNVQKDTTYQPSNIPTNIPTNIPSTAPSNAPTAAIMPSIIGPTIGSVNNNNNTGEGWTSLGSSTTDHGGLDLNTTNIDRTNGQSSKNNGNGSSGLAVGLIVTFVVLIILAGLIFWAHRKFGLAIDCKDGCKLVCSKDRRASSNYQQL